MSGSFGSRSPRRRLPRLGAEATIAAWVVVIAAVVLIAGLGPQPARTDATALSSGAASRPEAPATAPAPTPVAATPSFGPAPTASPATSFDPTVPAYPLPPATTARTPWPSSRPVPRSGTESMDGNSLSGSAVAQITLTSTAFAIPVSFWLDAIGGDQSNPFATQSDFCGARVTERAIVLPWLYACVSDLRILLPSSVACGTRDLHPDALSLGAAILGNPGLGARNLGPIETTTALPAGFVRGVGDGWVIDIPGTARPFDAAAADPDHCRIESGEPSTSNPLIEVRGDIAARLILLDVGGRLVIVRMAPAGYDGPSGAEAHRRHYDGLSGETEQVMVERLHDLSFGVAAVRP